MFERTASDVLVDSITVEYQFLTKTNMENEFRL